MLLEALLGAAACLAVVGLIAHQRDAEPPGGSPADEPPVVFVQSD